MHAVRRFLIAIVTLVALTVSFASVAGAASTVVPTPTSAFYLDLGGSASVGVQPTFAVPHGQPTSTGYANFLVALEAANGHALQLTELGCPGETTTTAMYGGDRCYAAGTNQLATAVAFLTQHNTANGIVTIDLGFNNVVSCLKGAADVNSCVLQGVAAVRQELPVFLNALQAAAGPDVSFIGVGHYDPFLADLRHGVAGRAMAAKSLWAIGLLNRTLLDVYNTNGIAMANVAGAFDMHVTSSVTLAGSGSLPVNVAEVCLMTWMCKSPPYGPNLHPNDAGYLAIAGAIASKINYLP